MFFDNYQTTLSKQLVKLQSNRPVIESAAHAIVDAMRSGHFVFCSEIGHGIQGDFFNRAGGLANVRLFTWSLNLNNAMPACAQNRPGGRPGNAELELTRAAVNASNMRAGDIIITCSVSGRNVRPIETALACRDIGMKVIAMTSVDYAKRTPSSHPSGKSLHECADWVIDLMTPYGDAGVDIEGYESSLIPLSSFSEDITGWMLWGRVMEIMGTLPKEERPAVFVSYNGAGGENAYRLTHELLDRRGY
jgi:uncharacterized phosphosugar-binding protein